MSRSIYIIMTTTVIEKTVLYFTENIVKCSTCLQRNALTKH